ncbi:alpha/beta fold hydrolase [Aeromicrobium sp. CTD01-1L150]|uniref:alpha/beta fold hydrolase n=1 Tax=Aeromicrobium sp. CTD01-1L150 TaxID=3341830 RepID=UPI0035C1A6BC
MVSPTQRAAVLASTAGAFVAAGVAARVVNTRQRARRRARRGEQVEFGTVHGPVHTVTASDGVRLNVEVDDGPTDGPTLVFVHGWVCTLDTWHYQRLALRGEHRMVFMDHRSHGGSGRSSARNATFEQLADDLHRVLEEIVPTGPIVLVGHSMGGMTIQQLAADHPELFGGRVVGVALIGTSSGRLMRGSPALKRLAPALRLGGAALDWGRAFNSYSVIQRWAFGPDPQERHVDMVDEMILRAPTHVLLDFYTAFTTLDLTSGLKGLGAADTVVVCGTQDLLTPVKHSRRLAQAVPGARLIELEGAGHMVMFEEHEEITAIIAELVERVR